MRKRDVFDLSEDRKFTCNMGDLVPILLKEVVPGDTFNVNTDLMLRMMPLVSPAMHKIDVYTHYFFVPVRLVYNFWEQFIGGGEHGNDNSPLPTIKAGESGFGKGSLADYFGLPVDVPGLEVLAFPFRCYNLIWNEWYRNQNLQEKIPISRGTDQPDPITPIKLQQRNWKKDYFTTSLPWTQRGNPVSVPLAGGKVPVRYPFYPDETRLESSEIVGPDGRSYGNISVDSNKNIKAPSGTPASGVRLRSSDLNSLGGAVDLSTVPALTINAFRQAFQIQKWMERNARNGVRYSELLLSHWGIKSSDARLQRPEFLGGGRSPVVISEVLQTSSTDSVSPQGNMAGHGFSVQQSHGFKKFFEEHGYVIGIMSVMPVGNYSQGVERLWSRRTRFDFPFPEFAHLGEQAVAVKELYAKASQPERTFGYQPRYEEYRRGLSYLGGDMRDSMSYWHLSRIFDSEPYLNGDFVKCKPSKRIFAVPSEHSLAVNLVNNVRALRIFPRVGEPGFVDH